MKDIDGYPTPQMIPKYQLQETKVVSNTILKDFCDVKDLEEDIENVELTCDVVHKENVIGVLDATRPLPKVDNFLASSDFDWFSMTKEELNTDTNSTKIEYDNKETTNGNTNTYEGKTRHNRQLNCFLLFY